MPALKHGIVINYTTTHLLLSDVHDIIIQALYRNRKKMLLLRSAFSSFFSVREGLVNILGKSLQTNKPREALIYKHLNLRQISEWSLGTIF